MAIVLLLAGGLYALYRVNSGKQDVVTDEATLAEVRQAFADEDYEQVVRLLEAPTHNHKTRSAIQEDPDLLRMYVTAWQALPVYNNQHLTRIITPLTRLIELEPENIENGRTLVDSLLKLDRNKEALRQAQTMVLSHPDDPALLRHLAQAQQRLGKDEAAFASLERAIQIEPLHVQTHIQMLDLIEQYGLPAEPYTAQAEQIYADHGSDTRAMMIRALAYQSEGDGVQSRELLKQVIALPPANQEMVPLLTQWLDRSEMYSDATRYLMEHAEQGIETTAGRMAIYRAFETNNTAAILERLKDSDPTQANTDLLGMWADAHRQAGSLDQASDILEELKQRDSPIASTWLMLIELDQQEQVRPAQIIDPIVDLMQSDDNPVVQVMAKRHPYFIQRLGEAYLEADEPEAAFAAFSVAVTNTNSWSRPHLRLAQTLIKLGQHKAALIHARDAQIRDNSAESKYALVRAMAGTANPHNLTAVNRVIYVAEQIPPSSPEAEQVLPQVIDLLIHAERIDEASQRLTEILRDNENLSAKTLASLLRASRAHGLGHNSDIPERIEAQYGTTTDLVMIRALAKADTEGFEQGLALLQEATPSPATKPWQKVLADYLTIHKRHDEAAELLVNLAEQYPEDLEIQLAALKGNDPDGQMEVFAKMISRLRHLAGESTIHWRIQQARIGMFDASNEQAVRETAELLREAESFTPVHLEVRMVLSRCYMMLGDNIAAAETAQEAKSITPSNDKVMLLNGMALHRLQRYQESRLDLIPLATNPRADSELRYQACILLNEQAEYNTVRKAVEQMWSVNQAPNPALILLAEIYINEGLFAQADKVCLQLLRSPDAATMRFVPIYYHQTNRPELAEQAIRTAQAAGISEANRLMLLAQNAVMNGEHEKALALVENSARLESEKPHRWYDAVQLALSLSKPDDAIRLAKLGLEFITDASLKYFVQHASLIQQIKDDQSLIPTTVTILEMDGYHEQAVRVLQITSELGQGDEAAIALAELASKHPGFKYLSELACDRLLRAGLNERAYPLAKSAMARFPDSGVTARVATLAAYRLQDWSMLLSAADAWAQRTPRDRINADLMRAAAMNKMERFGPTIALLQPYIQVQKQIDKNNQLMFEYYTHALVRTGESERALQTLRPHLSNSNHARTTALNRVSGDLVQSDAIAAWIKLIATNSSADPKDRFAIATALFLSGQRLKNEILLRQADQAVDKLVDISGPLQIDIQYAKGQIAHHLGNYEQAEVSYRKVLQKVPDNPQVLNNLALALLEDGEGKLAEAEQLAIKATQLASDDPNLLDTLAIVHLRRGQLDQGLMAIDKAIDLNSNNPVWYLTKADILQAMGETDRATQMREQYAPLLNN